MNESRLQIGLATIPLVSAGLYLLGLTYHQGYLNAFGIDDSLFPLAADRSLLFGFFSAIDMGLLPMLYAFAAAAVLFFFTIAVAILASIPWARGFLDKTIEKIKSHQRSNNNQQLITKIVDKTAELYHYTLGVLIAVIALILISFFSTKSGNQQALKEIKEFNEGKGSFITLYSPLLPEPTKAKQIYCSSSHCAFWTGNQSLVIRHEYIERITTRNNTSK